MSRNVAQLREVLLPNPSQVTRCLGMGEAELRLLREASQAMMARSEEIVGEIVGGLFRDPESARILQEAGLTREALQGMLRGWLLMAFEGDYGGGDVSRGFEDRLDACRPRPGAGLCASEACHSYGGYFEACCSRPTYPSE